MEVQPRYLVGDILGNDTSTPRYMVAYVAVPASGYPLYTTYPVVKSSTGWEIPKYWHGDYQLDALQVFNLGLHRMDHADPHFAIVTDPAITAGDLIYAGLSLGEIVGGTPGYPPEEETPGPIGGDTGYFLVSTVPAGAEIYLEDISGTRYLEGNTTAGPLNVSIYLTATSVRAIVANLSGYREASFAITQYPAKGQTVPVSLTLEPIGNGTQPYRALSLPGRIEAEDYDLGGEGVAYHDTTKGNAGGSYRTDDVDIEAAGGITNVGWVRSGEYLTYTATVTQAGAYTMTTRFASPNSGRTATFSVDGSPAATIAVPNTGSFTTFATAQVPVTLGAGTHTLKLTFQGDGQNLDWIAFAPGVVTTPTPTPTPGAGGASFTAAPNPAMKGTEVKFTVTPAAGKRIGSAWWSFDAPAHLNSWNSRTVNPTFYYPAAGTFSPLVKITYTDGLTETVQRAGYVRVT